MKNGNGGSGINGPGNNGKPLIKLGRTAFPLKKEQKEWPPRRPPLSLLTNLVVGWPEKPPYRFSLFSGPFLLKGRVQVVRDLFPTFHASIPDEMRFFRASKRQVPPFSVNSHLSVQNRSTFQLIYQYRLMVANEILKSWTISALGRPWSTARSTRSRKSCE